MPCQQISVLQRFLTMYLPLPFSCPGAGGVAEQPVLCPLRAHLCTGEWAQRGAGSGCRALAGADK